MNLHTVCCWFSAGGCANDGVFVWAAALTRVLLTLPCLPLTVYSIEPDGQRPKVLLHGKACRKTSDPKCSYEASGGRQCQRVQCCLSAAMTQYCSGLLQQPLAESTLACMAQPLLSSGCWFAPCLIFPAHSV